jgi:hypothetical protein
MKFEAVIGRWQHQELDQSEAAEIPALVRAREGWLESAAFFGNSGNNACLIRDRRLDYFHDYRKRRDNLRGPGIAC